MRYFLAIDLPEEAKVALMKVQKQLPEAKFKLVEPENLHLTLKFFGELSDFQVNKVKEALSKIKFEKFKASLGSIGVFPSSNFVRVVWVSMEPIDKVKELHNLIDVALEKQKFSQDKAFESHITLARVKFIKNKEEFVKKLKEIKANSIEFQVNKFSLKKSTLTKQGPIYETIKEFELD
ncbi:MAG: RNA 2',3'-cyclic phosphodiesterase [Candidatus Pacearchaeota archaeon]|nr:RNA 2',3'-cyclic phosphodiesterase [Candidatus Pacearchaeota archaeon]